MDHAGMASQLQELLSDCDCDGDGQLSRKEFFRVLADIGLDLDSNSKEAGQLFLSLDRNAAGVVSLDDLRAALAFIMDPAASRESAAAMPSSLVSMLVDDHKQKGNPILRLRASLASQGSRVIDMFNKWDTSGDGKIQKSWPIPCLRDRSSVPRFQSWATQISHRRRSMVCSSCLTRMAWVSFPSASYTASCASRSGRPRRVHQGGKWSQYPRWWIWTPSDARQGRGSST